MKAVVYGGGGTGNCTVEATVSLSARLSGVRRMTLLGGGPSNNALAALSGVGGAGFLVECPTIMVFKSVRG